MTHAAQLWLEPLILIGTALPAMTLYLMIIVVQPTIMIPVEHDPFRMRIFSLESADTMILMKNDRLP